MREATMIEHRGGNGRTGALPAEPPGRSAAGQLHDKLHRLRLELANTAAAERHARQVPGHDGLTALPSRAHFRLRLSQMLPLMLRAGRPLGLLCVGLNESSQVAAAYCQGAGDEWLRIVAARLRHALRAHDGIGRIGRVEFTCTLPDLADRQQGGRVARRLLDALAKPMRIGSIELSASASFGVAMFPGDGRGADELLDHADAARYRAKREHSDLAFYGQVIGR